jgi:hypothetical protein
MESTETKEASTQGTVADWKKLSAAKTIICPNGFAAVVQRRSLQVMWKLGMIPNDLMPFVQRSLSGRDVDDVKVSDLEPKEFTAMIQLIDRVVIFNVVEPRINDIPDEEEERDPDKLYIDEVDEGTKQFLYNYIMTGGEDLAPFRGEPEPDVGSLQSRKDMELQAESTP